MVVQENEWEMMQNHSSWSWEDDKMFERALVMVSEENSDRWRLIAGKLGKSHREVIEHYNKLIDDVSAIDSGFVELPVYVDDDLMDWDEDEGQISFNSKSKSEEPARKKGIPWSKEEHAKFLLGLERYGKGDWRSISRSMQTRTPTQVASHAQKYFLRQSSTIGKKKERKRTSIHDITTVSDNNLLMQAVESLMPSEGGMIPQQSPQLSAMRTPQIDVFQYQQPSEQFMSSSLLQQLPSPQKFMPDNSVQMLPPPQSVVPHPLGVIPHQNSSPVQHVPSMQQLISPNSVQQQSTMQQLAAQHNCRPSPYGDPVQQQYAAQQFMALSSVQQAPISQQLRPSDDFGDPDSSTTGYHQNYNFLY